MSHPRSRRWRNDGEDRGDLIAPAPFAAIAFFVVLALASCARPTPEHAFARVGALAPDFALVDQNGAAFRLAAFRHDVVILFFGYAHCEDVCPATLAHLHRALELLPVASRLHVRVAFVTIDPRRDDAAIMKAFVNRFDPTFYGLTGTRDELRSVYSAYRIFRQRIPRNRNKPYLVAHEGSVYIIDGDGTLRFERDWRDAPALLARLIAAIR